MKLTSFPFGRNWPGLNGASFAFLFMAASIGAGWLIADAFRAIGW